MATLFGRYLPEHGIHTDLVSVQDGAAVPWPAGRLFTRGGPGPLARRWAQLGVALDLFRLARRPGYAALQVRDRIVGGWLGLLAARCNGLPFFYWMSFPFPEAWHDLGAGHEASSAGRWQRLGWRLRGIASGFILYRMVLPRADHIFVQSQAMLDWLARRGVSPQRMTAVPMGVDLPADLQAIAPADDPRLRDRKVIVYLGALDRMRHPEVMIEAMATVVREEPQALLVLVGDAAQPGERAWLDAEIARRGLRGSVLVTGWLAPEQGWRYLRAARIGLSPFPRTRILEMASPTKVCEYLAYGIPVVANDQPDQAALLALTGGGLCVPLSADGFAAGILALLADPARAQQMSQAGRAAIGATRSYSVLARQLARQYRRLLTPGGGDEP
ncbi:MAG: glycosyltransferase family 4 protein [Pseudomonadota bacterium]